MVCSDLVERLIQLDEEAYLLYPGADRIQMIIVGGGALVLMRFIARSTHDIDVLKISHQIHDLLQQYDINTNVQAYMYNFPYNYEDRIKPIPIHGKLIDFYTASLEDIVVAKLYSNRDTDYADITSPGVLNNIDWNILEYLVTAEDEVKASALNNHCYTELLQNYRDYKERWYKCGS